MKPNPVQIITPGKKSEAPKPKPDPKNPGKMLSPLTLTVLGNKLIATCDDPEVLVLIQELTRLVTKDGASESGFEIMQLRTASAADIANVLQQAFNGPDMQTGRVRIVADPASNALLIQANAIDTLAIKRLLAALDVPHGESEAEVSNLIFMLKYTKAADVAKTIADIYQSKSAHPGRAGFSIGVDERTNSVIVRGTQAQIKEVKALIDQLDAPK